MKKWFLRLGIPLFVLAAYYSTDTVMTARAVLPPNAGYGRIAKAVLHPPYQMAAPHHSLIKSILAGFSVPNVCAGDVNLCNQLISAPKGGSCPYCPNCTDNRGCTIYVCKPTSIQHRYCEFSLGVYPCQACENDRLAPCTL